MIPLVMCPCTRFGFANLAFSINSSPASRSLRLWSKGITYSGERSRVVGTQVSDALRETPDLHVVAGSASIPGHSKYLRTVRHSAA